MPDNTKDKKAMQNNVVRNDAQFIITNKGRDALINAEHDGTQEVLFVALALGRQSYEPTADQEALKETFKVLPFKNVLIPQDISSITVSAEDGSDDSYSVYEMGIYIQVVPKQEEETVREISLDQLILFAVYSDPSGKECLVKTATSGVFITYDLILDHTLAGIIKPDGDMHILPLATEKIYGATRYATMDEVGLGEESNAAITPANLLKALKEQPGEVFTNLAKAIQELGAFQKCEYYEDLPDQFNKGIFYITPASLNDLPVFSRPDSDIKGFKIETDKPEEIKEKVGYLIPNGK